MTQLIAAQINTKSNFRNLNGQWIQVTQMCGTRITCLVEIDGRMQQCDFHITEISGFRYNNQ